MQGKELGLLAALKALGLQVILSTNGSLRSNNKTVGAKGLANQIANPSSVLIEPSFNNNYLA